MQIADNKRMAYSKLHASLVNSSLWTEEDHVRLLFITLLALCDKDGCVYGSRMGIERAAMIDAGACKERDPWQVLMGPDSDSSDRMRAPENEGRRIEEIPGGFRLLNFAYYRGLRNDDDRKEQNRQAQVRFRNRSKPPSAKVSPGNPPKAQAEAEAEAEAKGGRKPSPGIVNEDKLLWNKIWWWPSQLQKQLTLLEKEIVGKEGEERKSLNAKRSSLLIALGVKLPKSSARPASQSNKPERPPPNAQEGKLIADALRKAVDAGL